MAVPGSSRPRLGSNFGRVVVSLGAFAGVFVSGCARNSEPPSVASTAPSPQHNIPLDASLTRTGERPAPDAKAVVSALADAGFEVPNPQDSTAQECPQANCEQSVVTDVLRVKSFATAALAQRYALARGFRQDKTIVVSFAPPVSGHQRDQYWAEVERLVG